jgi:hypothetical protein
MNFLVEPQRIVSIQAIYNAFYIQGSDDCDALLVYKNFIFSIYHHQNNFFLEQSLYNNKNILDNYNSFKDSYINSYLMRDYSFVKKDVNCKPEFIKFNYCNTNNVLLFLGVFTVMGVYVYNYQ